MMALLNLEEEKEAQASGRVMEKYFFDSWRVQVGKNRSAGFSNKEKVLRVLKKLFRVYDRDDPYGYFRNIKEFFAPVNIGKNHWIGLRAVMNDGAIYIADNYHNENAYIAPARDLLSTIGCIVEEAKEFEIKECLLMPHNRDDYNCGTYVIAHSCSLRLGYQDGYLFDPDKMILYRKQIEHWLLRRSLTNRGQLPVSEDDLVPFDPLATSPQQPKTLTQKVIDEVHNFSY